MVFILLKGVLNIQRGCETDWNESGQDKTKRG